MIRPEQITKRNKKTACFSHGHNHVLPVWDVYQKMNSRLRYSQNKAGGFTQDTSGPLVQTKQSSRLALSEQVICGGAHSAHDAPVGGRAATCSCRGSGGYILVRCSGGLLGSRAPAP